MIVVVGSEGLKEDSNIVCEYGKECGRRWCARRDKDKMDKGMVGKVPEPGRGPSGRVVEVI